MTISWIGIALIGFLFVDFSTGSSTFCEDETEVLGNAIAEEPPVQFLWEFLCVYRVLKIYEINRFWYLNLRTLIHVYLWFAKCYHKIVSGFQSEFLVGY